MASSARIDELRKKFDENPRRYFAPLANEYRKAGDLEQAIFICQEYLPQQPGHMSGHIVYGQALFELGRNDEARTVFETALSLDPENLIALRHLGDIARKAGDTNAARVWYQRVLEADPRNEEIAQIMMSLLTPAASTVAVPPPSPATPPSPTAAVPPPVAVVDHNAPTPLSSPAVPPPIPHVGDALDVEKSVEASMASTPPPPVPPAKKEREEELLDFDSLDIGGVPLSTLRASKSVSAEPAGETDHRAIERSEELSFDAPSTEMPAPSTEAASEPPPEVSSEAPAESSPHVLLDEEFEADPFAIAATPNAAPSAPPPIDEPAPEPPIELATDLSLGIPDDGLASTMSAPPASSLDGLETFEEGVIASAKEVEPVAIDTGSFFDTPSLTPETATASTELNDETESNIGAEAGGAFVTETMAELYLQQGHLESALDIYRRLAEMRPNDAALQARLDAVEQQIFGTPSVVESAAQDMATPTAYGGPTIREFLAGLIHRSATPVEAQFAMSELPATRSTSQPEAQAEADSEPVDEDEAPAPPVPEVRPTPSSSQTVSESLDVFFSGADAAEPDATAANTLAEAFAPEGPATAPLHGVPAHRASNELSLDHVFKGGSPAPSGEGGADNFSFDQFFSPDAAEAAPAGSENASETTSDATDDIEQFNAWLNGLKKT